MCVRVIFLGLFCLVQAASVQAQELPYAAPYDGIQAGLDAYRYHEELRQRQIDRQLGAIEQMRWYRGLPPLMDPYLERYPPSLDYVYATGRRGILGGYRERWGYGPLDIFEPWPYVPGDIWGYVDDGGVPQPRGQRHYQTGPNRWESHPDYGEPRPMPEFPRPTPSTTAREF